MWIAADAAVSPRTGVADSLKLLLGADEEELATVLRQHREAVRLLRADCCVDDVGMA